MHSTENKPQRWLWPLLLALALLLSACGGKDANATPTMGVDAIYTAAFETFAAQQATQLALTPPTNTPAPTLTPTIPPPPSPVVTLAPFSSPTAGGSASTACDNGVYVSDVTIPDNTEVTAGKKFDKTWRIINKGSCTWDTSYKLAFDSGEQMGGTAPFVKVPVAPGAVVEMTVTMTAPTSDGKYTGTWRMQNASNQKFGSFLTVVIKVGGGATATAGPSPTAGAVDTFTISGDLGAVGVTLEFDTTNAVPTVTYNGSTYSFDVPDGWSGTITPKKGNVGKWTFSPESKTFTNVSKDMTQDFVATPH